MMIANFSVQLELRKLDAFYKAALKNIRRIGTHAFKFVVIAGVPTMFQPEDQYPQSGRERGNL